MQETQETWVQSVGQEEPLEEEMATHSSILAWKIPWTKEPGGLQSIVTKSLTRLINQAHDIIGNTNSHHWVDLVLPVISW